MDGGSAWAGDHSGWIDVYKGHGDSAIERFLIALELAPIDALAFTNLYGIGAAHFNAGRFREAALWQERALAEHPSLAWMHRTLCPAHLFAGARNKASNSVRRLQEGYPDLTLAKVTEGLHDVGLPL